MNHLAKNLRLLRKENSISQAQLASQLGKYDTAVSSWERGTAEPGIDDIQRMCKIFAVKSDEFLFIDLSDVHLTEKRASAKNDENVHLNVHPNVHLKGKKGPHSPPEGGIQKGYYDLLKEVEHYKELTTTLSLAVKALERSQSVLINDIEKLESKIRLSKKDLPEVGEKADRKAQRAVG